MEGECKGTLGFLELVRGLDFEDPGSNVLGLLELQREGADEFTLVLSDDDNGETGKCRSALVGNPGVAGFSLLSK